MQLRDHPYMSFNGVPNWPPEWIWTAGNENSHPVGEVGVLEDRQRSNINANVCFVTMRYDGATYVGRLEFDRQEYCDRICELLVRHYGQDLREIAILDIPLDGSF